MNNVMKENLHLGVSCSMERLWHVNDSSWSLPNLAGLQVREMPPVYEISNESTILQEVQVFRKCNENSVDFVVNDDGLSPHFKPGDYVAGIMRFYENIQQLIGMDCIVQLSTREILLRRIKNHTTPDYYDLICTNTNTSVTKPMLYRQKLIFAAPVIWHRRHNDQWH